MDRLGQGLEAEPADHGQRQLRHHLSSMPGYHCRPENFVASCPDVHLHESLGLAVEDRSVHLVQLLHERLHCDPPLLRLLFVEANVSNLWIGVGAPRDR